MTDPRDRPVADEAPVAQKITDYDRRHVVTYLRLLDALAHGVDKETIIRAILCRDPATDRAHRAYDSHVLRAQWMTQWGYRRLLSAPARRPEDC